MIQRVMTAQEFAERRSELPDAGQWVELIRGVPHTLQPPDLEHGNIVLNLSKALASYVQDSLNGYACFELGLHVEERPDTVLFPAVSYFIEGARFAEADKDYTDTVPRLVVELATTNQRRSSIHERVGVYLRRGVSAVWLIDSVQKTVHVISANQPAPRRLTEFETLVGDPHLTGFRIRVSELFAVPEWAK